MFVIDEYIPEINKFPKLTDREFMALQMLQLKHLFHSQITSIKNINHEFVAFTKKFAEEFGASKDMLGQTAADLPGMSKKNYAEIYKQEEAIITNREFQDSLYLLKKDNNEMVNYVMRKHPLINPATNKCVGILTNSSRVMPGLFRKVFLNKFLKIPKYSSNKVIPELSKQQQQLIFCLLLGFHSRKEIAAILSNMTNLAYNENQIKNSLQALYNKFECNTIGQLLNLMSSGQIPIEIPADVVAAGNYPLDSIDAELSGKNKA